MAGNDQNMSEMTPRELRRRRRMRNQILAFVFLFVLVVLLIVGVFFAGKYVSNIFLEKAREEEAAAAETIETETVEETVEETESVLEEYTLSDQLEEMVEACIDPMSQEDKIAGLFITTPEALTEVAKVTKAGNGTKNALAQYAVGGFVYHTENVLTKEQFSTMVSDTFNCSKYPLFFALDGECDKLPEDLSEVGINVCFAERFEDETSIGFRIVTLPSLLNGEVEEGPVTAQLSGEGEELADACIKAWKSGADMIYLPEHFADSFDVILEKVKSDRKLMDQLEESLKKVYRIKCRSNL